MCLKFNLASLTLKLEPLCDPFSWTSFCCYFLNLEDSNYCHFQPLIFLFHCFLPVLPHWIQYGSIFHHQLHPQQMETCWNLKLLSQNLFEDLTNCCGCYSNKDCMRCCQITVGMDKLRKEIGMVAFEDQTNTGCLISSMIKKIKSLSNGTCNLSFKCNY